MAARGVLKAGIKLVCGQDEILAQADGHRAARDIAFAMGRGVYATRVELVRMYQAGLLVTSAVRAERPQADAKPAQPLSGRERLVAALLPRWSRGLPTATPRHAASGLPP